MPKCVALLALLALPLSPFCQSRNTVSFGKIDKADLLSSSCAYDRDAPAEVLSDVGEFFLDFMNGATVQTLHKHVRIKILNDKGLKWADIHIPYYNKAREQISNVTAATYNLDESGNIVTTRLEKGLIYDKKVTSYRSEKIFTMPAVKVGSIIEYKYTINNSFRRTWYLQQSIPVRYSDFEVNVPSAIDIYLRPFCIQPYQSKDISQYGRTIKSFTISQVRALPDEDFMTCDDDYLQKIEVWPVAVTIDQIKHPLIRSWTEETKDLLQDELFGTQLKKSIPRTAELDQMLQRLSTPLQKMNVIYDYVRKNMTWDGVENIYASSGVKAAWKDKKGTAGEINLILVNLLKDAGLNAYPMVVSTHDNGAISTTFPDFEQFNKVMALVKIDSAQYVLDGTDKYTPSKLIPEDVMNTEALVIDETNPNKYWWAELWDAAKMEKDMVVLEAAIKVNGDMEGKAMIRSQDYSRINRARVYTGGKDQYLSKYCLTPKMDLKIDNLEIDDINTDSVPLIQKFSFQAPVNRSGEYTYFSANLFTGMPTNPFIADSRFSDVFFGANQSHVIVANITIPEGYEFEELPKDTRITLEDKSLTVTRLVSAEGDRLSTRVTLEYRRPFYTSAEYPVLKEFYKKMYSLLDEQFVIKKKA